MARATEQATGVTAAERFDALAEACVGVGATRARMFGSPCLKSGVKVFATYYRDRLVLKLPHERVAALTAAGLGEPFDPGMGRVMKEWIALAGAGDTVWDQLTAEARAFVSGG